jgi:hypothetical protein
VQSRNIQQLTPFNFAGRNSVERLKTKRKGVQRKSLKLRLIVENYQIACQQAYNHHIVAQRQN